ncbi:uncharacterized protein LOC142236849 [Haematobia irritans]|uniref:uncharacterized protein LOC142236849 n=1 Tax=Haematobia irritans TaxID=7368 RepID=UPI003F509F28
MDPSRHHDFISSNDERSRSNAAAAAAAYYNRDIPADMVASHRYYGSNVTTNQQQQQQQYARSHSAPRMPCECSTTPSGARITCNGCRLNPSSSSSGGGDIWPSPSHTTASLNHPASDHSASSGPPRGSGDYRQMVNDQRSSSSMRQNTMYIQHPPPPPITQQQQMQHHGPPHPSQSQSMVQSSHPPSSSSHVINRSNYWPQNSTSSSQNYPDDHLVPTAPPNLPVQSTTQTQIDISITRRSAGPSGPLEGGGGGGGSLYGQYKNASTAAQHHPTHSSSSYPSSSPSSNPLHQRVGSAIGGGPNAGPNAEMVGSNPHYITKERIYETKYSTTTTTTKIAYNSTASATVGASSTVYDNQHPHQHPHHPHSHPHHHMNNNMALSNKSSSSLLPPIDHHVINPSNLPASKDQHPSPNYARKCPQMYTPEAGEQSMAHHHNLYMPTPQFSLDKFSRASPQQQILPPDYTKLRESPSANSSAYMVASSGGGGGGGGGGVVEKYNHHATTHLRDSPQQFVTSRNSSSYYAGTNQNPSKVLPPEMSPIIMKQTHTTQQHYQHHQQYSKSPLPPPLPPSSASAAGHHQMHQHHHQQQQMAAASAKTNNANALPPPPGNHQHQPHHHQHTSQRRYLLDGVKREDLEIYESSSHPTQPHPQQSSRNINNSIYINPYNTPPPGTGDTCCKEVIPLSSSSTSPYTTGSATPNNYRVESPQLYHSSKYGKMSMMDTSSANKHASSLLNQNTPPPSRAPSQRGPNHQQPTYYYEGNLHSAPSPAAATAASPSPSSLLSSSTNSGQPTAQSHHTLLHSTVGPPVTPLSGGGAYPIQSTASTLRDDIVVGPQLPLSYERTIPAHHSRVTPPSKPGPSPTSSLLQVQSTTTSVAVAAAPQVHSSKMASSNVPNTNKHKPNYRELISRTIAMRNATSEEELNMQIIKKTLNVDSQNIRGGPGGPVPVPVPSASARVGPEHLPSHHHQPHSGPPLITRSDILATPPSSSRSAMGSVLVNHQSVVPPLLGSRNENSRISIKQEDEKPSSSSTMSTTTSPLDLSMRTVKTKADSTEYKYQQQRRLTPVSSEGRYTLPRVDATPVFSIHAFEPATTATTPIVDITGGSRPNSRQNSRQNSLERRNYTTPPAQAISNVQATAGPTRQYSQESSIAATNQSRPYQGHRTNETIKSSYESSMGIIKPAPTKPTIGLEREIIRSNVASVQSRPSVVETNPYATAAAAGGGASVIKSESAKRISDPSYLPITAATSQQLPTTTSSSSNHPTLAAVERLPPDTSIMALPPRNSYKSSVPIPVVVGEDGCIPPPTPPPSSMPNYSQGCERNPNFRKRHIQEYSSEILANEPLVKQSRYMMESTSTPTPPVVVVETKPPVIAMRPADISVIAVNETNQHELEKLNKMKINDIQTRSIVISGNTSVKLAAASAPVIVSNHKSHDEAGPQTTVVVCKQEPLTPTGEVTTAAIPPAKDQTTTSATSTTTTSYHQSMQMSSSSSSRIRTKAELKGFTFNALPPMAAKENEPITTTTTTVGPVDIKQEPLGGMTVKVKEEPEPETTVEDLPFIPGLEDNFGDRNLLDFGWSNTCNNFVEQLQTRPAKKKTMPNKATSTTTTTPTTVIKEPPPMEMVVSSTDVTLRKPLENHFSPLESAADTTRSSFARFEGGVESGLNLKSSSRNQDTINSPNSTSVTAAATHKKLNKIGREKKRFQQEKRLAERLLQATKDSSSESEDELDKRKTERLKKPLMKTKNKLKIKNGNSNEATTNSSSNQQNEKNRFSDCGSDSSTSSSSAAASKAQIKVIPGPKSPNKSSLTTPAGLDAKLKEQISKSSKDEKLFPAGKDKTEKNDKEEKSNSIGETSLSTKNDSNSKVVIADQPPGSMKKSIKKENSSSSSKESSDIEGKPSEKNEDSNKKMLKSGGSCNEKSNTTKSTNSGSKLKIGLNTMTRSKLKKEMEMQLANSKVLRNDKIIRNSSTKIKRKYVRKYGAGLNSYLETGGLSRECGVIKSTRLRAKLERKAVALKTKNKISNQKKLAKESLSASSTTTTKNSKTENVHDPHVIELYRFKRALKVPPSLISIKSGSHKIAASLPDLERHAEALDAYAKNKKKTPLGGCKPMVGKQKNGNGGKTAIVKSKGSEKNEEIAGEDDEPRSIIDVLHSRVTKASGLNVSNKSTTTTASKAPTNKINQISGSASATTTKHPYTSHNCSSMFSETSQTTESSELQMLPPLRQDSDEDDDDDNESAHSGKKRHFSIFDTTVLPTKTRTESKLQQKKENIREIFVGDDRPASAPAEMVQAPDNGAGPEKVTYVQKYEQFLQQMNIVVQSAADKFGKFGRTAAARKLMMPSQQQTSNTALNIKQEEIDTESTSVMDPDELKDDEQKSAETTHTIRKKRGKYLRRKGSSGFDYIRKKKKPSSSASNTISSSAMHHHNHNSMTQSSFHQHHHHHHLTIKSEKMEADEYEHKMKTEDDVSREIQKWVLNKGVGQSTMHKAARQGYIDVIVYCLERMSMNPDQKDNAGYTPLHEACTNGWLDIARVLLQYGANHSAAAHSGIRPLHEASENDHEEIVRLLLSYGADPLLATYSGQTPLMLAPSTTMRDILNNHLLDVQSMGPERKPWKFNGPWELYDPLECGYNVFEGAPNPLCDMSRALFRRGSLTNNQMMQSKTLQQQQQQNVLTNINTTNTNSNNNATNTIATLYSKTASSSTDISNKTSTNGPTSITSTSSTSSSSAGLGGSSTNNMANSLKSNMRVSTTTATTTTAMTTTATTPLAAGYSTQLPQKGETTTKTVMDKCAVVLDKLDHFNSVRQNSSDNKSEILVENSDSDGEMFEFEEADILLPPLYLLKDEGTQDKWVLLSDLCNLLKVKSKDTLLNKIYPPSSSAATAHKSLMRELKMSDFLEKATCLQLLCAGEKLNICASKVVLIKYNENVRNLLGVNTILMKF